MAASTVLITGTSTGIGRATALDLDRRGFTVFATVRRAADADALREAASPRLRPLLMDVTDADAIAQAAREVEAATGGRLDGLVNNAGIAVAGPMEFVLPDALRRQLEVNVIGQVAVTQAFLPMIRAARGRIVFVGSVAGRSVLPFAGAYSASKYALEAITDALRLELDPWGIEVSIVEPGSIDTPIWRKSGAEADARLEPLAGQVETLYGETLGRIRTFMRGVAGRSAPPQAVADAIRDALTSPSPKTRYLVGQMARVRALLQLLPDRLRDRIVLRQLASQPTS